MEIKHIQHYHQGIRIDKIPASGFAGLLFTVATIVVFMGIPEIRVFSLFSLAGGALTAAGLHYWHTQTRW